MGQSAADAAAAAAAAAKAATQRQIDAAKEAKRLGDWKASQTK